VVRDADGLRRLAHMLGAAPARAVTCRQDAEDVALTLAARTVTAAALARTESRGCHHRAEYPSTATEQGRSALVRLAADFSSVEVATLVAVG
jgi:L-aspartate oxidase